MVNVQMLVSELDNPIVIVSLSETKLTNVNESCYTYMLTGYKFFSKCRHNELGGGVAAYVLDKYNANILNLNIIRITFEYLVMKIIIIIL